MSCFAFNSTKRRGIGNDLSLPEEGYVIGMTKELTRLQEVLKLGSELSKEPSSSRKKRDPQCWWSWPHKHLEKSNHGETTLEPRAVIDTESKSTSTRTMWRELERWSLKKTTHRWA